MSLLLALVILFGITLRCGIEDNDWSYCIAYIMVFIMVVLIGSLLR